MSRPTALTLDQTKGLHRKLRTSMTFAVIIGNRAMFPRELVKQGREDVLSVLKELGHEVIVLSEKDTEYGSVSNFNDAKKCADLFRDHKDEIDGIIITLPNFGDEKSIANTLRMAKLDVPVLVQAEPDVPDKMRVGKRRDSFCGKLSVCSNLNQYGIRFTLTKTHTCSVKGEEFKSEVAKFVALCRVVNGLRGARLGAIGARPADFNTVRYSEKILERAGVSVEPLDLSEIIGRVNAMRTDEVVTQRVEMIKKYVNTTGIPSESLERIAKLAIVVERWVQANDLDAVAFQCWSAIEEYLHVAPCTAMSIMSSGLIPAACEVDVTGSLTMLALQLASGTSALILDWNNNYGDDPNKAVAFHCSNLAAEWLINPQMKSHFAETFKPGTAYGPIYGRIAPGPVTYARISTSDTAGSLTCYVGEGKFTEDPLDTFGGYGVIEIPGLQQLLRKICVNGFEHHFAVTRGNVAGVLQEAFGNYLGMQLL